VNRPLDCILCLLECRLRDLIKLGVSENSIGTSICKIKDLLRYDRTTAFVESFEIIKRVTGKIDPYADTKKRLKTLAEKVLRKMNSVIKSINFIHLIRIAAAANVFDTQVLGYVFNEATVEYRLIHEKPLIDETNLINWHKIKHIVYILDNHGEAVFDRFVISKLIEQGYNVTVIVRGSAYEIDVTIDDALELFKDISVNIVSVKGSYPALYAHKASREILNTLEESDIIIAKGIANLEAYLDSKKRIDKQILFLLRAKCPVISALLKVPRSASIAVTNRKVQDLAKAFNDLKSKPVTVHT